MGTHKLLTGQVLDLSILDEHGREYLRRLAARAEEGTEYFDLLRAVKGPGALPLRGGRITPEIASSVLYRVAHDIADRAGIKQGYLLAPEVQTPSDLSRGGDLLSLTEAAELLGITRPAVHQALVEGRLRGRKVGNAWIVSTAEVEAFQRARQERSPADAIRTSAATIGK